MTSTAIFDLDMSWEARWERAELTHSAEWFDHLELTREVSRATMWNCSHDSSLVFIELPGPSLRWEWRIFDAVAALLFLVVGTVTVIPAAWAIWTLLSERVQPVSIVALAQSAKPWQGLSA